MSLPSHSGIFAVVERQCADSEPTPPLRLFDGPDPAGVPLALVRARQLLYDRSVSPAARADLWHQVAERARFGGDGPDWPTAVVWLGLPGLRKTAFNISWRCRAERGDVEAELVTCYLEELAKVGAHHPDPGGAVLRSACSRAWSVWRKARLETAVDDVDRIGGPREEADAEGYWQADYEPVPRASGLSAPVRITVPAHRVEGVRLGALARAWGVADAAASVGYSGRGRQVAKISLRRAGTSG
ncbi:hypothetical protein JQK87_11215 [Streptomyces sp. G44]|uniref:hypothetical protein n=1 Tax=Streptomyces sp. G44 TaxID=2807632 RepID=UPI001960721D|nr:hypothetical protein [Streptomyces sp. G44]MBM7168976.1 hypothetical protein [Streptomyces sp. G44]